MRYRVLMSAVALVFGFSLESAGEPCGNSRDDSSREIGYGDPLSGYNPDGASPRKKGTPQLTPGTTNEQVKATVADLINRVSERNSTVPLAPEDLALLLGFRKRDNAYVAPGVAPKELGARRKIFLTRVNGELGVGFSVPPAIMVVAETGELKFFVAFTDKDKKWDIMSPADLIGLDLPKESCDGGLSGAIDYWVDYFAFHKKPS
jgi:hypothetical protein